MFQKKNERAENNQRNSFRNKHNIIYSAVYFIFRVLSIVLVIPLLSKMHMKFGAGIILLVYIFLFVIYTFVSVIYSCKEYNYLKEEENRLRHFFKVFFLGKTTYYDPELSYLIGFSLVLLGFVGKVFFLGTNF